jgi:hypothetical protein
MGCGQGVEELGESFSGLASMGAGFAIRHFIAERPENLPSPKPLDNCSKFNTRNCGVIW